MSAFIDFLDLVDNEVKSLLNVCPPYITAIFYTACLFSIILALKRAVID